MHYEINVARKGRHLFATAERSLTDLGQAQELYAEIIRAFPDCDVYLTQRQTTGYVLAKHKPSEESAS
jgi:hypothetical protein